MATMTKRAHPDVVVLRRVPFSVYVHLTKVWENRHLRMAYHDGTLEIVSPQRREHERPSRRLAVFVTTLADHLGIVYEGTAGTTFHTSGGGVFKGKGKEPDQSFYFASFPRLPQDREVNIDAGDPPPDLWIEVDNRISSKGRLPIYASLGVPEIWRYRARTKTLQFLRLTEHSYEPIDRSLTFPDLTSALVLEALVLGDQLPESSWTRLLREWIGRTFPSPPGAG